MKKRMMVGMLTMLLILLLTGCQKPKDDGIKGILAQTEHGEWMFLETEGEETKWACLDFVTEYSQSGTAYRCRCGNISHRDHRDATAVLCGEKYRHLSGLR